jgi:hypothetical protein
MPVLACIGRSLREFALPGLQIGDVDNGLVDDRSPRDPISAQEPCGSHWPLMSWTVLCNTPEHIALDAHYLCVGHV